MKRNIFILLFGLPVIMHAQITIEKGSEVFLGANTELIVQGDMDSRENIEGEGTVILNGTSLQTINLHNNKIPRLTVENRYNVALASPLNIDQELSLKTGHLQLGQHNLYLAGGSVVEGNSTAYIQSDNDGKVIKSVSRDLSGFILPVGTAQAYTPLLLRSAGSYQNGYVEISAKSSASPNKPAASRDYLENYWTIDRKGINGDLVATAFYGKVTGDEQNIRPYYWNGNEWINKETPVDTRNKLVSIDIPEGRGQIYAMRKGDELFPARSSMTLLPNPVKNTATVIIRSTTEENTILRITDNNGATVITQRAMLRKGVNQVNINVTSLANGYYTISSSTKTNRPVSMIKN